MALLFNIEEDEFYQEGVEAGIKKTLEKANLEIEKANLEIEKANLEKKQAISELLQKNILKAHQSGIEINMIANIFDVSDQEVKKIIKNAK